MELLEEKLILKNIAAGNVDAFERLFFCYQPRVMLIFHLNSIA